MNAWWRRKGLMGSLSLIVLFTLFYLLFGCAGFQQKAAQSNYEFGKDQVECREYAEKRAIPLIPFSYSEAYKECMEAKGYPKTSW